MNLDDLFSPKGSTINIVGIDPLVKLCKYHPVKREQFLDGLELAEDLQGAKGVTLYTSGTQITPDRITRLVNLCEANANLEFKFKIKRSAKLIENFRKDIKGKLSKLLELRQNYKVYSNFLGNIQQSLDDFIGEIFTNEDIVLTIFKMKFSTQTSDSKNAALFFNHTVSVALFAYAISRTETMQNAAKFTKEDSIDLIKTAFFHNIGAVCNVNEIITSQESERKKKYNEYNRSSGYSLSEIKLSFDVMDAIRFIGEYHFDRTDFVKREDNKACWYANIILVADMYVQQESGLFGQRNKPSRIVDSLNLAAMQEKINLNVVQAMTKGLNLDDIFDFYQEIDSLINMCPFEGGKHALPYPMTGFKSPTIFICKDNKETCEQYEKSLKAVTLVKPIGDLAAGKYARCMLTTPKLMDFYKEHYEEIKKDGKD